MRFLDFNSVDKIYPGPGLSHIPPAGALPEEDRWSGPHNDLSGGDSGRGPGRYVKDVPDLQKGTGTSSGGSAFRSTKNYIPPRSVPR